MLARTPLIVPRLAANVHLDRIGRLFPRMPVDPAGFAGARFLFVCFTNRSGSTFLCAALQSDGRLPAGGEMLNHEAVEADRARHGHASLASYLAAQHAWRARSGRLVVKLHISHLELLARYGILDAVRDRIDWVFIERDDRLAQAISYDIASQTGQWTSAGAAAGTPRYSGARLAAHVQEIALHNQLFDMFFGLNGIVPVHVLYERLLAAPMEEMRRIGAAIGMPDLGYVPGAIGIERQAGPRNAAWRARFLAGERG